MKELHKDIIILLLILTSSGILNVSSLLYPYWSSYYHKYNPKINMKFIYTSFLLNFFGRVLGNIILPKILKIFGCKKTLRIGSLLFLINCFFFQYAVVWVFLLNVVFFGVILQFKVLSISYYMSKKYENGIQYLHHIYTGWSLAAVLWSFLIIYIINPENKERTVFVDFGGYKENLFDFEVAKNFRIYLWVAGFTHLFVTNGLCWFLRDVGEFDEESLSVVMERGNYSFDNEEMENFRQSFNKDKKDFENNNIINTSKQKLIEKEHQKKNKKIHITNTQKISSEIQNKLKANKIIKSQKFILLIVITILKTGSCLYFKAYFKFISYSIINNDNLVSIVYALVTIPDISGRYLLSYLWKKYSFYNTFIITFIISIIHDLLFIFIGYKNSYVFLFMIMTQIMNWAMLSLMINMTLFSLYKADVAILVSKVYELNSFLTRLYVTFFNYFFVLGEEYRPIFTIFLIGEIVGLVVFVRYFKGEKMGNNN